MGRSRYGLHVFYDSPRCGDGIFHEKTVDRADAAHFSRLCRRSNDRGIGLEPAHPGDRGDRTGRGRRMASGVRRLCSRHPAYAAAGRPAAASAQRCGARRRTAVLVPTHDAACTRGNPAQYSRRNGRRPVVCTRRTAWRQQGTGRSGRCARARHRHTELPRRGRRCTAAASGRPEPG